MVAKARVALTDSNSRAVGLEARPFWEDDMRPVNERLSTFAERIERLAPQYSREKIIISDMLDREYLLDGENRDIEKEPILWPLYDYHLFYIVRAAPGAT